MEFHADLSSALTDKLGTDIDFYQNCQGATQLWLTPY